MVAAATRALVVRTCETVLLPLTVTIVVTTSIVELETDVDSGASVEVEIVLGVLSATDVASDELDGAELTLVDGASEVTVGVTLKLGVVDTGVVDGADDGVVSTEGGEVDSDSVD